ncbi:AAA family ATPase [Pseudomonas amygdali pv. morsprunorum]|nr:AAA family ATPase [Pseudomonas amygdali pv. morsprunorum]
MFEGRLIALCGVIGSGKTVMLRRLQRVMEAEENHRIQVLAIEAQHQTGHLHRRALLRPVHRKTGTHPDPREKRERDLREAGEERTNAQWRCS